MFWVLKNYFCMPLVCTMNLCLIDVLDGINWLVCVLVCCFWVVSLLHARNSGVASTVILVQASSSRLGENSWDSPRFCSSSSPRRRALVLSDTLSRSSESDSPKRVLEENLVSSARVLVQTRDFEFGRRVISLRRGSLAQATAHRVSLLQASPRRECLA